MTDMSVEPTTDIPSEEMTELIALFGPPARPIERTPEMEAYLDWHLAYVEKHGHQP
jgi:hypothetical protein